MRDPLGERDHAEDGAGDGAGDPDRDDRGEERGDDDDGDDEPARRGERLLTPGHGLLHELLLEVPEVGPVRADPVEDGEEVGAQQRARLRELSRTDEGLAPLEHLLELLLLAAHADEGLALLVVDRALLGAADRILFLAIDLLHRPEGVVEVSHGLGRDQVRGGPRLVAGEIQPGADVLQGLGSLVSHLAEAVSEEPHPADGEGADDDGERRQRGEGQPQTHPDPDSHVFPSRLSALRAGRGSQARRSATCVPCGRSAVLGGARRRRPRGVNAFHRPRRRTELGGTREPVPGLSFTGGSSVQGGGRTTQRPDAAVVVRGSSVRPSRCRSGRRRSRARRRSPARGRCRR